MVNKKDLEILVTDSAKKWLSSQCQVTIAPDFVGYLIRLEKKSNIVVAIGLDEEILIVPLPNKNKRKTVLNSRKLKRIQNKMLKMNIIEFGIQPFEELRIVPTNKNNMILSPFPIFSQIMEVKK